jgi:protein tyrosine/serine phosphatase
MIVARKPILAIAAGLLTAAFGGISTSAQSNQVAQTAQRQTIHGIDNFAQVNSFLFRGAQPSDRSYADLKHMGINVVVDFRDEKDQIAHEKTQVEAAGMQFLSLPWSGRGEPTHDQVLTFLNLMHNPEGKKVFVHCRQGRDRTGTMVALYRLTFDNWSVENAISEMKDFHYHAFMLPGLARYVRDYPSKLKVDPTLAAMLMPVAATAASTVTVH